jgi:hypothetical protein
MALDEERLIALASLPPDDPRRVEAERDPEARAWLLEYEAFVAAPTLSAAERADAAAAAGRAFAAERGAHGAAAPPAPAPIPLRPARTLAAPRWLAAAAALVVVAGGAWLAGRPWERGSNELRGVAPAPAAPGSASITRDRILVLRWDAVPGADEYTVELLRGLEAVAHFEAGTACTLAIALSALGDAGGGALLWRVVALEAGEEVSTSPPRPLPR